jgi:hypothetical protein
LISGGHIRKQAGWTLIHAGPAEQEHYLVIKGKSLAETLLERQEAGCTGD